MSDTIDNSRKSFRTKGFIDYCGFEVIDEGDGSSCIIVDINDNLVNMHGFAHGGVLFSAMDSAAGAAEITRDGVERLLVTQAGDIHYMKPAKKGIVKVYGKTLHSGVKTAVVQCSAYDSEENLLARGTFEMFFL